METTITVTDTRPFDNGGTLCLHADENRWWMKLLNTLTFRRGRRRLYYMDVVSVNSPTVLTVCRHKSNDR